MSQLINQDHRNADAQERGSEECELPARLPVTDEACVREHESLVATRRVDREQLQEEHKAAGPDRCDGHHFLREQVSMLCEHAWRRFFLCQMPRSSTYSSIGTPSTLYFTLCYARPLLRASLCEHWQDPTLSAVQALGQVVHSMLEGRDMGGGFKADQLPQYQDLSAEEKAHVLTFLQEMSQAERLASEGAEDDRAGDDDVAALFAACAQSLP